VGFRNLLTYLKERRRGATPTVGKGVRTLGFGSGVFIPQRRLSVVPTQVRYYQGFEKIETVRPYR
jgi:hypothetical protein